MKFQLSNNTTQEEIRVFPGVRGKAARDIKISEGVIIPKGSRIIIQPLNADKIDEKQQYKITLFDKKKSNSDLREAQRSVQSGASYTVEIDDPRKNFHFKEHYKRSEQPLFATNGSPSLEEIQQGRIPNCFLLAAMQSIINHPNGKEFIRGMMRQNDDGTTTVRLFDPETGKPVYVRVNNAILVEKNHQLNRHTALWVHVLEQAYVAMGRSHKGEVDASASSVFSDGGHASKAATILTGLVETDFLVPNVTSSPAWSIKPDEITPFQITIEIADADEQFRPHKTKVLMAALDGEVGIVERILSIKPTATPEEKEALKQSYLEYVEFYIKNQDECDEILRSTDSEDIKLINLIELAGDGDANNSNTAAINFLKDNLNYSYTPTENKTVGASTPAFSGFYTEKEHEFFLVMKNSLENGQLVTCGTVDKFDNPIPGLRNQHAYTVLKVFTRQETTLDPETGEELAREVRYVQLRNPWGQVGRVYQQKEGTLQFEPQEDPTADIFEVELTDFCGNFDQILINSSANELFARESKRHELEQKVENHLSSFHIESSTPMDMLIEFKKEYKIFEQQLIALEMLHIQDISNNKQQEQAIASIFTENLDEKLEKIMIEQYFELNDVSPSFYVGNEENKYTQLYNLVKLDWLMKQDPLDNSVIEQVQKNIVKNASYDFCASMEMEHEKMLILSAAYARSCTTEITDIKRVIDRLETQIQQAYHSSEPLNIEELFHNLVRLQKQYQQVILLTNDLDNLGSLVSKEQLEQVQDKMVHTESLIEELSKYDQLNVERRERTASVLEKASKVHGEGFLTDEEHKAIEARIRRSDSSSGSQKDKAFTEKTLNNSPEEPCRALGKELNQLEKLLGLLDDFKNTIKNKLEKLISKFTSPSNTYMLPADKEKKPAETATTTNGSEDMKSKCKNMRESLRELFKKSAPDDSEKTMKLGG